MKTFLKRILQRPFIFIVALLIITLSCEEAKIEPQKTVPEEKVTKTSLDRESHLKSVLTTAGFTTQELNGPHNGRTNQDGVEIDTENIIKVSQGDNRNYTYTFNILDDHSASSFSNLILEETGDGYLGFILQYVSSGEFNGLLNFTGTLNRFDLAGQLLSEIPFMDGQIAEASSAGGRAKVADCLAASIQVSCLSWGYFYDYNNTQTTGFGCLDYQTTIDIYHVDCPSTGGTTGPSGSTGVSSGTYILSGGGGGAGSGGTSSGGSTSSSIGVSADEWCGEGMYFDDGVGKCVSTTYIVGGP